MNTHKTDSMMVPVKLIHNLIADNLITSSWQIVFKTPESEKSSIITQQTIQPSFEKQPKLFHCNWRLAVAAATDAAGNLCLQIKFHINFRFSALYISALENSNEIKLLFFHFRDYVVGFAVLRGEKRIEVILGGHIIACEEDKLNIFILHALTRLWSIQQTQFSI
ncbi:hypothetical protein FF38_06682 [Lucilia cuprina]|uniref:Uncharacterized protein n=1 Tax=Lucilia cuprina TaxID=7375 RepID=A0A0L0C1R1_LUCCU|nr:hypothetical protein FF38_06682 [Lucilia cuprina]